MSICTCDPYMSVVPPPPCPYHDPERAYWFRLLQTVRNSSCTWNSTDISTGVRA